MIQKIKSFGLGMAPVLATAGAITAITWTTELGLEGLMISGLLTFCGYVMVSSNMREDQRLKQFTSTLERLDSSHREERQEWRSDAVKREERSMELIRDLEETIQQLSERIRDGQANVHGA